MNSDVHPVVAALVLVMAGVAAGLWMWASGVAASFGGPAELRTGPNGHGFVQIQNYLVEHDSEGAFLRTHELDTLDVELFLGGFAFFSNGDTLLRRGPAELVLALALIHRPLAAWVAKGYRDGARRW